MSSSLFFFFNDTATTEIYTLSLHDALPICGVGGGGLGDGGRLLRRQLACPLGGGGGGQRLEPLGRVQLRLGGANTDRESTRLNSSHRQISYAVLCLKKKNKTSDSHRQLAVA